MLRLRSNLQAKVLVGCNIMATFAASNVKVWCLEGVGVCGFVSSRPFELDAGEREVERAFRTMKRVFHTSGRGIFWWFEWKSVLLRRHLQLFIN